MAETSKVVPLKPKATKKVAAKKATKSTTKKKSTKKPAAKKAAPKKTVKKTAAKTVAKKVVKKASKKTAAKKPAAKKVVAKKTATPKKAKLAARKAVAKKTTAKRTSSKPQTKRTTTKPQTKITETIMKQTQFNPADFGQAQAQFDQFTKEAADINREGIDAFVKSGTIFAKGFESLVRETIGLAQSTAEKQMQLAKDAMTSKTINEFSDAQNKIAQTSFDDFMSGATKLTELSTKVLTEAIEPINDQVAKSVQKATEAVAAE